MQQDINAGANCEASVFNQAMIRTVEERGAAITAAMQRASAYTGKIERNPASRMFVAAVSMSGYPNPAYDGVYVVDTWDRGFPMLRNQLGKGIMYYYLPGKKWKIADRYKPDDSTGGWASVVCPDGMLPGGTVAMNCFTGGEFKSVSVTFTHSSHLREVWNADARGKAWSLETWTNAAGDLSLIHI